MHSVGHLFPELIPRDKLTGPVLVIVPHPDDETIGCGGTLAYHVSQGHRVVVVHATDGCQGDPEGRFSNLIQQRRAELKAAMDVLGVTEMWNFGFQDGTLAGAEDLGRAVEKVIRQVAPATLYTMSPFDCHQDHRVLSRVVAKAAGEVCARNTVCMVMGINNMGLPNTLVDITGLMEIKDRALRCYSSQLAYIDFATKVMWRDKAATVNIEDQSVVACEAFMRIPISNIPGFMEQAIRFEAVLYGK